MNSDVRIGFSWVSVGEIAMSPAGGTLRWPTMPTGSGVYRFTLTLRDRTRFYVGETDSYRRRFGHYANPGPTQSANVRMKARLVTLLSEHRGSAHLHVATEVGLTIDGRDVDQATVPDVFVRRLLEKASYIPLSRSAAEHDRLLVGGPSPSGDGRGVVRMPALASVDQGVPFGVRDVIEPRPWREVR